MKILLNSSSNYISQNKANQNPAQRPLIRSVNFAGAPPTQELGKFAKQFAKVTNFFGEKYDKIMGPSIEWMAKRFAELAESKPTEHLINWIQKHPKLEKNLFSHLIVLGSTMLSGFYVVKTLNNKQMDSEKRKTLAINQGLTYALSTVMAYTVDDKLKAIFKKHVIDVFDKANKTMPKAEKEVLKSGLIMARTIMVFDTVYRFIAPVVVTPFANALSNKLKEDKAAKKANLNKQA